jgi:hypothetical protein
VMSALGGDFGYKRSGFASAEEEEIHVRTFQRFNHRGHRGAQRRL